MAKKAYKPLLFTTTVRNPARFKQYLFVLSKYEGQTLDDTIATQICGEAMRFGLYRPNMHTQSIKEKWGVTEHGNFGERMLDDTEVAWLLKHNPQRHKEAGYSWGWPSRFATIFGAVRQFGFANINPGSKIEISGIGRRFLLNIKVEHKSRGRGRWFYKCRGRQSKERHGRFPPRDGQIPSRQSISSRS